MEVNRLNGNELNRGNQERHYKILSPMNEVNHCFVNRDNINQTMNQYVRSTLTDRGISLIKKTINTHSDTNERIAPFISPFPIREEVNNSYDINKNNNMNHYRGEKSNGSVFNKNFFHMGYNPHNNNHNQLRYGNNRYNALCSYQQGMPIPISIPHHQFVPMNNDKTRYYLMPQSPYNPSLNLNRRLPEQNKPNLPLNENINSNFNFLSKSMQTSSSNQHAKTNIDNINSYNFIEKADINISYDNFVLDEEKRQRQKELYKRELLTQMKNKEQKKAEEKERKQQEEREEEARIERENEEISLRLQKEKNTNRARESNIDYINQYTVIQKKQTKTKLRPNEEEVEKVNQSKKNQLEEWKKAQDRLNEFNQKVNKSKIEFEDAVKGLREHVQSRHTGLFDNMQSLKNETSTASKHKEEAFRQIEAMKKNLVRQRIDEALRKKYVYDLIDDDRMKILSNNKGKDKNNRYGRGNVNSMPQLKMHHDNDNNKDKDNLNETIPINKNCSSIFIDSNEEVNMNVFEYIKSKNNNNEERCPIKIINSKNSLFINDYMVLGKYFKQHKEKEKNNKIKKQTDNQLTNKGKDIIKQRDKGSYFTVGSIFLDNLDRLNYLKQIQNSRDINKVSLQHCDDLISNLNDN